METIYFFTGFLFYLLSVFAAGLMASMQERNFWAWCGIGMVLPFVAAVLLVFLPSGKERMRRAIPVENEELFNHLFLNPVRSR